MAEQEKAKAFQGGLEIHGGFSRLPLTWAFWLPQTVALIKTHTQFQFGLGRKPAAEKHLKSSLGDKMLLLPWDLQPWIIY